MGEFVFDLLLAIPLAIICAFAMSLSGFLLFGPWGGGLGLFAGLAVGLYLEKWIGARADAAASRRKLSAMMLTLGVLLAAAVLAVSTR